MTAPAVRLAFPLPSIKHSKNYRAGWQERRRLWAQGRDTAIILIRDQYPGISPDEPLLTTPVRVHLEWRFARGRQPDFDNAVARVAHLLDALHHTGILADDQLVQAMEFDFERVKSGDEGLVMTIRAIKRWKEAA